jgi:hypothetical protein
MSKRTERKRDRECVDERWVDSGQSLFREREREREKQIERERERTRERESEGDREER